MALASVGGGYQTTDGNISELTLGVQAAPQTATASRYPYRCSNYVVCL
jgi:hypothetical protein